MKRYMYDARAHIQFIIGFHLRPFLLLLGQRNSQTHRSRRSRVQELSRSPGTRRLLQMRCLSVDPCSSRPGHLSLGRAKIQQINPNPLGSSESETYTSADSLSSTPSHLPTQSDPQTYHSSSVSKSPSKLFLFARPPRLRSSLRIFVSVGRWRGEVPVSVLHSK